MNYRPRATGFIKPLWIAVAFLLISTDPVIGQDIRLSDLNRDMIEYRLASGFYKDFRDRQFLSNMTAQNILWQVSLLDLEQSEDAMQHKLVAESMANFAVLHDRMDSPCWAEWALTELRTNFADYLSPYDTITKRTYKELFDGMDSRWQSKYAKCVVYNELVPARDLTFIDLRFSRSDLIGYDVSDSNLIDLAQQFLNRGIRYGSLLPITIFLPPGEYKLIDDSGTFYPKEFRALSKDGRNELRYLYLTPNMSFNFVPVARITDLSDNSEHIDTLSPGEFELRCFQQGFVTDFENVEFGRYTFEVRPPYELVDNDKKKLIIPYGEFGPDYLERHSELFSKEEYRVIYVHPGDNLVYRSIRAYVNAEPKSKSKRRDGY